MSENIKISDEVIAVVAGIAATSVKGVAGMTGSIANGIAELLGKKSLAKGVKVSRGDEFISLGLGIVVEYGSKIPDVAADVQQCVKEEVESMTGLDVAAVDISVDGVKVPAEKEEVKE